MAKRVSPMTNSDRNLLTELVKPFIEVIENKESGLRSVIAKKNAWKKIASQYNTASSSDRDEKQLKKAWDNAKMAAKKAKAEHRREMKRTGGGPVNAEARINDGDGEILSLLGDKIDSLINAYDDDADFNDEIHKDGEEFAQPKQSTSTQADASDREALRKPLTKSEVFMEYEKQEHEIRMEYWRLKIQFLKEEHEEKMKKFKNS